jgi:hypothetical protein
MPKRLLSSQIHTGIRTNMSEDDNCCDSMSDYSELNPNVPTRKSRKKSFFGGPGGHVHSGADYRKQRSTLMKKTNSFCRHHLKGDDEDSEEYEARIAKRVQEKSEIMKFKASKRRESKDPSSLKRTKGGNKIKRKESIVNKLVQKKSIS